MSRFIKVNYEYNGVNHGEVMLNVEYIGEYCNNKILMSYSSSKVNGYIYVKESMDDITEKINRGINSDYGEGILRLCKSE